MGVLQIRLVSALNLAEEECKDEFGLPFLPAYLLRRTLRETEQLESEDFVLMHARIAHHDAICSMLGNLEYPEAVFVPFVFSQFSAVNGLKEGLEFEAQLEAPVELQAQIKCAAESIKELRDTDGKLLGHIEVKVYWNKHVVKTTASWHAPWYMDKKYTTLSYTLQVRSPLCFSTPYEQTSKTRSYMEGGWMRQAILRGLGKDVAGFFKEGGLSCSHAFVMINGKRSMPSSYTFATRKLEKTDLRDRISDGKRPDDWEPLVAMRDSFVDDVSAMNVAVATVDKRRVHVGTAQLKEGISEGQQFAGKIHGTYHQLRAVYEFMVKNPVFQVGDFTEAGCGEVLCHVDKLEEEQEVESLMLSHFDVFCLSPVLLTDSYGLTNCETETFLKEIEYWLKAEGKLKVEKVYREIGMFNSTDPYWRKHGANVQGNDQGSAYRIRTKDDSPIDVAPLMKAKLGDRVEEGFGDILVMKAVDSFYRKCEFVTPDTYSLETPVSDAAKNESDKMRDRLLYNCMRNAVDAMGRNDVLDCESYNTIYIPMELLQVQAERYKQHVRENMLRKWYLDSMLSEIERLNPEQEMKR